MAPRAGLDRDAVVAAAIDLVDREGIRALSLARLAEELGVRTPSLYNHVDGQAGLRKALWISAVCDLGDVLRSSILGRSGDDALFSFATAFREYALRYPGRYQLTMAPDAPFDDDMRAALHRSNEAFQAVIRSYGVGGSQARRAGRAFRAAVHGFVVLESENFMGSKDRDDSFHFMIRLFAQGLRPRARVASFGAADDDEPASVDGRRRRPA